MGSAHAEAKEILQETGENCLRAGDRVHSASVGNKSGFIGQITSVIHRDGVARYHVRDYVTDTAWERSAENLTLLMRP